MQQETRNLKLADPQTITNGSVTRPTNCTAVTLELTQDGDEDNTIET